MAITQGNSKVPFHPRTLNTRMLGPEGGGLRGPTLIREGNKCKRECWAPKGVEPLRNRRILKTLRRSSKRKAQRGQYLLAVGLSCYMFHLKSVEAFYFNLFLEFLKSLWVIKNCFRNFFIWSKTTFTTM